MWRKIAVALAAVTVVAAPVLAIGAATPPSTIAAPAKAKPAGKIKQTAKSKQVAKNKVTNKVTNKATKNKATKGKQFANSKVKAGNKAKRLAKSQAKEKTKANTKLAKKPRAKLALIGPSVTAASKIKTALATQKDKQIATVKAKRSPVAAVKDIKATEPVETTGSVAPRSVPTPGLY